MLLKQRLVFWIGESYWRAGYCTEATKAIISFSFKVLGLQKLTAEHLSYNIASGKVMEKSGMSYVASVRKECRAGELGDIDVYEIVNG